MKMNYTEELDEIVKEVSNMTSEQLQVWCKSEECYNYLNR